MTVGETIGAIERVLAHAATGALAGCRIWPDSAKPAAVLERLGLGLVLGRGARGACPSQGRAARGASPSQEDPAPVRAAASVALVLAIAAGCAAPSVVENVGFHVVTPENRTVPPDSLMRPGTRVKVDRILLTDSLGTSRPPAEAGEVSVEVTGGTYDAKTREIVFSDDRSAVRGDAYEVMVVHADGVRSVQRFKADFALLHGPDASDVRSFRVTLIWRKDGTPYEIMEGTPLIPGEAYEVRAVANDVHGRKFSSTDSSYPVPADRIEMTVTGFARVDPTTMSLVSRADLGSPRATYEVAAVYDGDTRHGGTLSFPFDPAIAEGPAPEAVAGLEIGGNLSAANPISPGAVESLRIRVMDVQGRTWILGLDGKGSHLDHEYPLPASRLAVETENARYARNDAEVRFNADARAMLGEQYRITVRYADDPRLTLERVYAPDFLSIVPLMDEDELTYAGTGGRAGREGRDGQQGSRGNDSARVLGRAGDGRAGGHGTGGQNGARGSPGPNLRVIAREVRTIDARERLVLFEVRAPGVRPEYYIRSIDAPPVSIISRGGPGGAGGDGGSGGEGGNGGDGYYSGDGGNGGTINLILTTHELEKAFVLDSRGGIGGPGGGEGRAGQPGIPGSVDSWSAEDEKSSKDLPPPEVGAYGNEGNIGFTGRAGHDGLPGMVQLAVDENQAAALVRRVPQALQAVILY